MFTPCFNRGLDRLWLQPELALHPYCICRLRPPATRHVVGSHAQSCASNVERFVAFRSLRCLRRLGSAAALGDRRSDPPCVGWPSSLSARCACRCGLEVLRVRTFMLHARNRPTASARGLHAVAPAALTSMCARAPVPHIASLLTTQGLGRWSRFDSRLRGPPLGGVRAASERPRIGRVKTTARLPTRVLCHALVCRDRPLVGLCASRGSEKSRARS